MTYSTPWDDIRQPDVDYNVRRIPVEGKIPVYWGKDAHGHCLVIIDLEGDHQNELSKANMNIQGIHLDLRQRQDVQAQTLVITLVSHINLDLFHALCTPLVRSLGNTSDARTALTIALNQLKRWQRFLAGEKPRILSNTEVRGLFAELYFLRLLYKNKLSHSDALEAWIGPDGGSQDFVFEDTAWEIKTLTNKEPSTVQITSEKQLESPADRLFLTVGRIIESAELPYAMSLNQIAQMVEDDLSSQSVLEEYQVKLETVGYAELPHYDHPLFQIYETYTYQISEEFPRIIASELPTGLENVRYTLDLDSIGTFICPIEMIWSPNQ